MTCAICGAPAQLRYRGLPGFAAGLKYDIAECTGCGTSWALDAAPPDWLYAKIYEQPELVGGYHRYERFAHAVEASRTPLRTLMACEDVYFAVGSILRELQLPHDARVLEIGCGLGYLTYALARVGFAAEGWDVAPNAIAAATRRFGPHYKLRDANHIDAAAAERFDVVIFTSFIEHVNDPAAFLNATRTLLAPGGAIVLTTDNKSFFDPAPVWHSDLPPVHQWWFTESGIATLAQRAGLTASFFDFSIYNAERPWERIGPFPLDVPTVPPRLDAAGEPAGELPEPDRRTLFPLSRSLVPAVINTVRRVARSMRGNASLIGPPRGRRLALGAVLRPANETA